MAHVIDWRSLEAASPLVAHMPERLRQAARTVQIPGGGSIFRRGDRPSAMYFVVSGEAHLLRRTPVGHDVILQRARSGFLAEASLDQSAYHCDALAIVDCTLMCLPQKRFSEALSVENFRQSWIAHLSRELRRVRAQAERLSLKTARERVIHYLETEGERATIVLAHSKKQWAAELGLTHEALYRTLACLTRERLIALEGSTIRITRRGESV